MSRMSDYPSFTPPEPALADDQIGGLALLNKLRRNAFTAFPARCFDEPIIKLRLFGRDLALVNLPEPIQHVLSGRPDLYRRVPTVKRVLGPILGRGLAVSEGEAWRHQRRVLAPAFTPRVVPILATHISVCTAAIRSRLEQFHGRPVDLLAEMQALTLQIASNSMFSLDTGSSGEELRGMVSFYSGRIGRPRVAIHFAARRAHFRSARGALYSGADGPGSLKA